MEIWVFLKGLFFRRFLGCDEVVGDCGDLFCFKSGLGDFFLGE
jgi:hypothetical protein